MPLMIGDQIKSELANQSLIVKKSLGDGGQGAVFLVEGPQGGLALKWYNTEQATAEQHRAIRDLIHRGPPKGAAGRRFVWPLDLARSDKDRKRFGYLMSLIDTGRFAELGEIQAHLKPAPSYPSLCEISYQAANSYRALHLSGYCYRDISAGNLMFDPASGEVLICDNDNVGVNRQSECQVWGTMEYMAPELVLGEAKPSTDTDLHSLAVLLFNLWTWHHPLHGEMEYQFRSWEMIAKTKVYGKSPVFIFDPNDRSNCLPADPEYTTADQRWRSCPPSLQKAFTRAFTIGLREPARRVTEGEWQNLFLQLKDGATACPKCQAESLWDASSQTLHCWHCKKPVAVPPLLVLTHAGGKQYLVLGKGVRLLQRHVSPLSEAGADIVLGQVVQNPANPSVWGIRNLTQLPWQAVLADGTSKEYGPQVAVPLNPGIKLTIAGASAEIVA